MTQKDPCIRQRFVDFQVLSGLFIRKHDLNFVQGITHFFSEEIEEDLVMDQFDHLGFQKAMCVIS